MMSMRTKAAFLVRQLMNTFTMSCFLGQTVHWKTLLKILMLPHQQALRLCQLSQHLPQVLHHQARRTSRLPSPPWYLMLRDCLPSMPPSGTCLTPIQWWTGRPWLAPTGKTGLVFLRPTHFLSKAAVRTLMTTSPHSSPVGHPLDISLGTSPPWAP